MSEKTTDGQSVPSNVLLADLRSKLETARTVEEDIRKEVNMARRRLSAAGRARHSAYKRLYAATLDRYHGHPFNEEANTKDDRP